MNIKNRYDRILEELSSVQSGIREEQLEALVDVLLHANHIFLAGKGRSGLVASAFANRLMHLGFSVSLIGEITSPHTNKGDALIVISGSGETSSLTDLAKKAKSEGVRVLLLSTDPHCTLAAIADAGLYIEGLSTKFNTRSSISVQPMGALFEQTVWILTDAIVLTLMDILHMDSNSMALRHANLE